MRVAFVSLLVAGILAAGPAFGAAKEPDAARGARLYSANCGRCHNYRSPMEHGDREWSIVMAHMRVVAGLPGDQARDIEHFLRSGNNPVRPSLPPVGAPPPAERKEAPQVTPEEARALIRQNGCIGCHVLNGVGGTAGPNLDTVFQRKDERWVRTQIRNPRANNPESVMPLFPFSEAQVDAIVELLRQHSGRSGGD